MAKNTIHIPKFLTEMRSIWLFLATIFVVTIVFSLVYRPAYFMKSVQPVSSLNIYIYSLIMISSGAAIIALSRMLLHFAQRKMTMEFFHFVLWLVLELVFMDAILTVIAFFLGNKAGLPFSDKLWHVTLDMLLVIGVPYIITVLMFYLDDRRRQIAVLQRVVNSMTESGLNENDNINFHDRGGKLAFSTRRGNVLYIEAADNYSNIHYINEDKEDTFILHNSMKQLDASDEYKSLLRCHRGYMVNIDNVKLLKKEKGILVLELTQGARSIPVSKTYTDRVVRFLAGEHEA